MDDTKSAQKQLSTVTTEFRQVRTLDPATLNVYHNKREIDDAVATGTFDINKTQYLDKKTGRMYFLTYTT